MGVPSILRLFRLTSSNTTNCIPILEEKWYMRASSPSGGQPRPSSSLSLSTPSSKRRRREEVDGAKGGATVSITDATPRPPTASVFTLALEPEKPMSGGVTYQKMNDFIAIQELAVLRKIVQREECLATLGGLCSKIKALQANIDEAHIRENFLYHLDCMRVLNVEVVEVISAWRRAFIIPPQFIQGGVNYLLKIVADLDFIAKNSVLASIAAPIRMKRNPFVLDRNLDERLSTPRVGSNTLPDSNANYLFLHAKLLSNESMHSHQAMVARPVDDTATPEGPNSPTSTTLSSSLTMGSLLIDMLRVREAEKVLMVEEASFGPLKREKNRNIMGNTNKTAALKGGGKDDSNEDHFEDETPDERRRRRIHERKTEKLSKIAKQRAKAKLEAETKAKLEAKLAEDAKLAKVALIEKRRIESAKNSEARARAKREEFESETIRLKKRLEENENLEKETVVQLEGLRDRGEWGESVDILNENLQLLRASIAAIQLEIAERQASTKVNEKPTDGSDGKKDAGGKGVGAILSVSNKLLHSLKKKNKVTTNDFSAAGFLMKQRLRSSPMIILVSYDIPDRSRKLILSNLLGEFPNEFLYEADAPLAYIDDVKSMQHAMKDSGKSMIVKVNVGLTPKSRDEFLEKVSKLHGKIDPPPFIMLVHGDDHNRSNSGDSWFGVGTEAAKAIPGEIAIKHHLEMANEALETLSKPLHKADLALIHKLETTPKGYLSVVKAIKCLVPTIAEMKVKDLLHDMNTLISHMREAIDTVYNARMLADAETIRRKDGWPTTASLTTKEHGNLALSRLVEWVDSILAAMEIRYKEKAIPLQPLLVKHKHDKVNGHEDKVITVLDGKVVVKDRNGSDGGFDRAYTALKRRVLLPTKVFKTCRFISGNRCYIRVYHDCGNVYIDVYNTNNGTSKFLSLEEAAVDPFMSEYLFDKLRFQVLPPKIPKSAPEMYLTLCRQLYFVRTSKDLTLPKSNMEETIPKLFHWGSRIHQVVKKFSGHRYLMSVCIAAKNVFRVRSISASTGCVYDQMVTAPILSRLAMESSPVSKSILLSGDEGGIARELLKFACMVRRKSDRSILYLHFRQADTVWEESHVAVQRNSIILKSLEDKTFKPVCVFQETRYIADSPIFIHFFSSASPCDINVEIEDGLYGDSMSHSFTEQHIRDVLADDVRVSAAGGWTMLTLRALSKCIILRRNKSADAPLGKKNSLVLEVNKVPRPKAMVHSPKRPTTTEQGEKKSKLITSLFNATMAASTAAGVDHTNGEIEGMITNSDDPNAPPLVAPSTSPTAAATATTIKRAYLKPVNMKPQTPPKTPPTKAPTVSGNAGGVTATHGHPDAGGGSLSTTERDPPTSTSSLSNANTNTAQSSSVVKKTVQGGQVPVSFDRSVTASTMMAPLPQMSGGGGKYSMATAMDDTEHEDGEEEEDSGDDDNEESETEDHFNKEVFVGEKRMDGSVNDDEPLSSSKDRGIQVPR